MKNQVDLSHIYVSEEEIAEARKILGDTAKNLTAEELKKQIASMKYLVEDWMDDYEKSIFDGKTLAEKISA